MQVSKATETALSTTPKILSSQPWLAWLKLALALLVLAALAPRLVDFFSHSWQVLGWRWQIDYDEGLNLSASWNLSQGHNIYANSVPDRFVAASYPPFYFLLNATFLKIFGVSLFSGRLLSFGASLWIGFLIGLNVQTLARRWGSSRWNALGAGLFSGLLWLCLPPTYIWASLYKQDLLAIAIALTGLTLVYRWQDHVRLYWAAPILALAFFTKQNELAAVGVAGLYIVWREIWQVHDSKLRPHWPRAIWFGLALAVCVVVPFLLLNLLTKNGYYNHIIGYQLVPWNFDDLIRRLGKVVGDNFLLIGLATLFLVIALVRLVNNWRKGGPGLARWFTIQPNLFVLYLAVAGVSLFTLGAYQGNYNLTLDVFPPLLIAVGAALAMLVGLAEQTSKLGQFGFNSTRWLYPASLVVVTLGLGWQILNLGDPGTYFSLGSMPGIDRRNLMERLALEVSRAPGDFLSDDSFVVLSQGRALPYDNLYHMRLQTLDKKWDDQTFLQDLRDRRFGLVLLEHNARRFTDEGWQILNANYELVFPDGIDLWRPRPRPTLPQHSFQQCQLVQNQDHLTLNGYSLGSAAQILHAGDGLTLTTYWQTAGRVANNYSLFVHLIDGNGKLVAQRDAQPDAVDQGNKAMPTPTKAWQSGVALLIDQSLPLPPTLPAGNYTLMVGAYQTGANGPQNMTAQCSQATGSDIVLGQVSVKNK